MQLSALAATATYTFTKLKCNFNICATDISTATNTDVFKPGHQTRSAEPIGKQRTAAAIQRQQTSFLVVYDQQAGPSRPLMFTLTPTKHFNRPSVVFATCKESQNNISGLLSFFGNL